MCLNRIYGFYLTLSPRHLVLGIPEGLAPFTAASVPMGSATGASSESSGVSSGLCLPNLVPLSARPSG